jgi:hypothetical protein
MCGIENFGFEEILGEPKLDISVQQFIHVSG